MNAPSPSTSISVPLMLTVASGVVRPETGISGFPTIVLSRGDRTIRKRSAGRGVGVGVGVGVGDGVGVREGVGVGVTGMGDDVGEGVVVGVGVAVATWIVGVAVASGVGVGVGFLEHPTMASDTTRSTATTTDTQFLILGLLIKASICIPDVRLRPRVPL